MPELENTFSWFYRVQMKPITGLILWLCSGNCDEIGEHSKIEFIEVLSMVMHPNTSCKKIWIFWHSYSKCKCFYVEFTWGWLIWTLVEHVYNVKDASISVLQIDHYEMYQIWTYWHITCKKWESALLSLRHEQEMEVCPIELRVQKIGVSPVKLTSWARNEGLSCWAWSKKPKSAPLNLTAKKSVTRAKLLG